MKQETYTTSLGKTITFRGVSPFEIDELRRTIPSPAMPSRKIATAIPDYEEEQPLDKLPEEELTEIERAQLARYRREMAEANRRFNALITDYVLSEAIEFELSDLDAWKSRRQRWGLPIPEDEHELRLTYVRTGILGGAADIEEIVGRVIGSFGLDEQELASVRGTFRRRLRRDAVGQAADSDGEVELQPAVHGDAGGAGVGPDAE
ncbi:MAG: hypothetical protein QM346_11405 [Chloroflexota bacterium]|nr:hypothetical protein [Chloroflexota bacterium]